MRCLVLLVAAGCQGEPVPGGETADDPSVTPLVVADLHGGQVFWTALPDGETTARFGFDAVDPDACQDPEGGRYCLAYQARPHTTPEGTVEVVFTYSRLDRTDGDQLHRDDLLGEIVALDASREVSWRLEHLDLSAVDSACVSVADDPCTADSEAEDAAFQACHLYQPHDQVVTDDIGDSRTVWVADTRNARLLEVVVEDGDRCGRVETLLDRGHPDWDIYLAPNSLELGQGAGPGGLVAETWALMSIKDTYSRDEEAEAQLGGDGRGKVVLFAQQEGAWRQVWEFPPESEAAESYVNSPHGVAWISRADGPDLVLFAHSLGRSADFNDGEDGSIGVLLVDGETVTYAFDAVLDGADLRYPRDVRPLSDGRLLVVDSGCKGGLGCERGTALWEVRLPADIDESELSGAWSASGADQQLVELDVVQGPLLTGAENLYSVEEL